MEICRGGVIAPLFLFERNLFDGAVADLARRFVQNIQITAFFRRSFVQYAENKKSQKYFDFSIDFWLGLCYNRYRKRKREVKI